MSAEQTPGPWVVYLCEGRPQAILPAGRTGDVCEFSAAPTEADAKLIAAAPELLAAARLAVRMLWAEARSHLESGDVQRRTFVEPIEGAIKTIEAAIAKAGDK